MRRSCIIGLWAVALLSAIGLPEPAAAADALTGYECTFTDGSTHTYESGAFMPTAPGHLAFRISDVREDSDKARLTFGSGGASELRIVRAIGALHFIEVAVEGYLNITTVYEDGEGTAHPAVHSRHLAVLGQPVVSQFYGSCAASP